MRLKYLVSMKMFILTCYFQKFLRQNGTYITARYVMEFSNVQIVFYSLTFYSFERDIFGCILSKQK